MLAWVRADVGKVEDSSGGGPGGSPPQSAALLPWNLPGQRQDSVATIEGNPPPPPAAAGQPPPSPIAEAIARSPIGEAVQRVFGAGRRLRALQSSGAGGQAASWQRLRKAPPQPAA